MESNNPLGLRYRKQDKWNGLADPPVDAQGFCRFTTPVFGLRASVMNLLAYQDRRGIRTIDGVVRRWAPPEENDTERYVRGVVKSTGFKRDEELDLHSYAHMRPLIEAMLIEEGGKAADAQIDKALTMAGIPPDDRPLGKSRTFKSGRLIGGGSMLATVSTAAMQVQEAVEPVTDTIWAIRPMLQFLKPIAGYAIWAAIAMVVLGLGWYLYARWDDRQRGLR